MQVSILNRGTPSHHQLYLFKYIFPHKCFQPTSYGGIPFLGKPTANLLGTPDARCCQCREMPSHFSGVVTWLEPGSVVKRGEQRGKSEWFGAISISHDGSVCMPYTDTYGHIYHQYTPIVLYIIYTIHGSYGIWLGVPKNRWFTMENTNLKWMMTVRVPPF